MTLKAFYESDKRLALFNDYVVDLTAYAFEHPGGTHMIQQCNKKEIGKFIYGAYSMENSVSPHRHSFIAMLILEKLIVAKIAPERQLYSIIESKELTEKYTDTEKFIKPSTSSIYKVVKVKKLSNNWNRVVMKDNVESSHCIFRDGVDYIGKHYAVASKKNHVARYYTVWHTFHSEVYRQYLDAFDNVLTGKKFQRKFETIEQISNEKSDSIELFMKFYKESTNGITKQISEATKTDRFKISGLFGKGLRLDKENISGKNLIVAGGTGILPFIDLFAYLARRLINKKAEMSQVFLRENFESYMNNAKFLVFAFYPDKENAVGIEFWEKVAELFLHFGLKNKFTFLPRFTNNGDAFITTEEDVIDFLEEVFSKTSVKNIYVCGPPTMNNLFQRATEKIWSSFNLRPDQIEIM